jgi:hypothetical protein
MKLPAIIPAWVWLLLVLASGLAGGLLGFNAGENSVQADQLETVTRAIGRQAAQDGAASGIGQDSQGAAAAATATIQGQAQTAEERIHVIYKTVLAPADCTPAPGVRNELDAAHERAAGAVRAAAGLDPAAVPDRRDLPRDRGRAP